MTAVNPSQNPAASGFSRRWLAINAVAILVLGYFVLHFLTGFRLRALFTDIERQIDFRFWYEVPRAMLERGRYPASETGDWVHVIFPYLPSAAAMMLPLSTLPRVVALALWLALQALSFAAVIWATARLSGALKFRGWPWIAFIAAMLAGNAVSWDLRNHNNNLVYLALVMLALLATRTWLSAVLLAMSCNLKLYSGGLIAVLAWRREYRLAAAATIMTIAIAVLLPLVFGFSALPQLAADWLEQIRYTASPANQSAGPASLFLTASTLLSADPLSSGVTVLVRGVQAVWLALVAAYFLGAGRGLLANPDAASEARLADACVALMAPLPLSTWFMPYHGVVMLPAFMLLIVVMAPGRPAGLRASALMACIGTQIARFAIPDWNYRALVFLTEFVLLVLALAALRRNLQRSDTTGAGLR